MVDAARFAHVKCLLKNFDRMTQKFNKLFTSRKIMPNVKSLLNMLLPGKKGLDNLAGLCYNKYIKSKGDTPMKSVYYWDMDGVLADYHGYVKGNWSMALRRDTFVNLPAFRHNVDLLNSLLAQGITCYILTKAANADAMEGKRDWLKANVPALDDQHFICITKGRKVDSMKEEGILIDDDATNCKQWTKAGFKAIYLETKGQDVVL